MKRLSLVVICALLLSGCTTTPSAISKGELVDCSSLVVDPTVKGTELECLDGSAGITLEALRGPAIVNVWGSWCWPCQQEMPLFVEFYGKYKEKVGLIGVNVEEADIEDARNFVKSYGMTWPNLHDADGSTRQYLGMGVPITLFVNDHGAITYRKIGVVTSINELERLTQKYLGVKL